MAEESKTPPIGTTPAAAEHVAEAKAHLTALRAQLDKHPDLEAAIERLELALSILTTRTGGML
ncbi:MAG TPA: hypothetical protein VE779_17645 [Candidatus Angelobacter sp.]|nr:hypothetical protein [Candidatus Angelobacter sp.]